MDFLNRAFAQTADLFRSMTPGVRITAGLLLCVVVVSLAYLFNHQISGASDYLLGGHGFSADELPAAQAALASAGLTHFQLEGNKIRVPKHQQAAYVAALAEGNALPINWGDYLTRAANIGNLFPTKGEQEERMKIARQQEVSLMLRSMKDVLNAGVLYESKKKPGLLGGQVATASVAVKLKGERLLEGDRVRMIRHFVAGAFNMDPNQVTVVDLTNSRMHMPPGPGGLGSGEDHPHLAAMEAYRKEYEERIRNALAHIPGVSVVANVELSTETLHKVDQRKYDPKVVNQSVFEQSSTKKADATPRGGPPGLGTQQPNAPAKIVEVGKATSSEEETQSRQENNLVNSDHTQSEKIGLTPERVTVSIGVPSTYFEEEWRRRNPTAIAQAGQAAKTPDPAALAQIEVEEITKIRQYAAHLLPKPENLIDPTPLVNVMKFSIMPTPDIPPPATSQQMLAWLGEYWTTLGVMFLGLVSLVMLRSMIRAALPESRPLDLPSLAAATSQTVAPEAAPEAEKTPPKPRSRRKVKNDETVREDLIAMVREDPDSAAAILRGWIGNAS